MRKPIDRGLSIYLDLARVIAAALVLMQHVWPLISLGMQFPWPGHEAMIVFFVLSGYVIAYTASAPTVSLNTYAVNRAARILSVAIPALLLSAFIALLPAGPNIVYAEPMKYEAEQFLFATIINAIFLGQSFGWNISPPLNGPFWSICYEVWYYVIFATWMYSSTRWRIVLTAIALMVAGLKILALLPVWLLGVWLFHRMPHLTHRQAVVLFIASSAAAFAFYWFGASHLIRDALRAASPNFVDSLRGSNQFIGDFILGLIVTANFVAVASLGAYTQVLIKHEKRIRYASSYTLSIYLYHMPLTVLIWNGLGVHHAAGFLLLLSAFIVVLGMLTERRIKFFRTLFTRMFEKPALWFAGSQAR